jgi:hypothetical protein
MEDHHQELEEVIQREVDQLPNLQAPLTLIPRVLAAIQAQEQAPWWRQPWVNWPSGYRMASLVAVVGVIGAALYGAQLGSQTIGNAVSRDVGGWLSVVSLITDAIVTLANAAFVVVRSLQKPWMLAGLGFLTFVYLGCVGIGTLCFQLTFNNANRSPK